MWRPRLARGGPKREGRVMSAPQPEGPSAVGRDQGVFGSGLGVSWWLAERGVDLKAIRRDRGARRHPNDGHGRREQPHADYRTSRHQEIAPIRHVLPMVVALLPLTLIPARSARKTVVNFWP